MIRNWFSWNCWGVIIRSFSRMYSRGLGGWSSVMHVTM